MYINTNGCCQKDCNIIYLLQCIYIYFSHIPTYNKDCSSFSLLFIQLVRILPITNLKRELSNYLTNEGIDLLTKLYNIIKIDFSVFLSRLPTPPLFDSLLVSGPLMVTSQLLRLYSSSLRSNRKETEPCFTNDSDESEVHSHWTNCRHA